MHTWLTFVAVTVLGGGADAEFALVHTGKPVVRLVYADGAPAGAQKLSQEQQRLRNCVEDFRQIIERISGANLPVVSANENNANEIENTIQIGLTPAAIEKGLGERVAKLKPHSLLIHADPDSKVLYLLGSTLEGSGHAMYEYLESLGCRWFMPGPFGEKLPAMTTINVGKLDFVREPEFELRAIQLRPKSTVAPGTKTRAEVMQWMQRNKFGGTGPSRGHQFAKLVPTKEYWDTHPEYYSLREGSRRASHLCMTNPEVLDAAEKHLTEFFTKNPTATGYPVALADGKQYCECPKCTKACGGEAKNIMPLYLSFTGKLFDRIDKEFPDRDFQYGFYVYSNLMDVPVGRIPKQLAPYVAPLGYDAFHTSADPTRYLELSVAKDFPTTTIDRIKADPRSDPARFVHRVITKWSNGTNNIYFRDYDPYVTFAQNMPLVRAYQLAIEIPWHKEIGVRGYTPEATANSWFTSGINFWIRGRYYWNANSDIKMVMEEYCRGMFGDAWEPMYRFLDALARRTIESPAFRHGDHVLPRLYSVEFVEGLDFYLQDAERLASTEEEKARVQMWRLCQQHMMKYLTLREAEQRGDFVTAAALGDDYLRFLDHISTVNPHFVDHRWYAEREFGMPQQIKNFRHLAARLNGKQGRAIAVLPTRWWFRHDPNDIGVKEGWQQFKAIPEYDPGQDLQVTAKYPTMPDWRLQSTETSWQTNAEDYAGYNWYRTQIAIPKNLDGEKVSLLVTGIFGHMDFFVNGQRVTWPSIVKKDGKLITETVDHLDLGSAWSWNYNETFEVRVDEYLRFGEPNTFVIRTRDRWNWGGIFKRAQLITPLTEPPLPTHQATKCDCNR